MDYLDTRRAELRKRDALQEIKFITLSIKKRKTEIEELEQLLEEQNRVLEELNKLLEGK